VGRAVSIVIAVAAGYLILRAGIAVLRGMVAPMPEPPPPGELRRVKLRYRCPVCGMEVRVTAAADEDPVPPRHCMDEMELIATADD
jgi:hypothetical protein